MIDTGVDLTPHVELDFRVHWCRRHLEPFRARWPEGSAVAMVKLFEAAAADGRIIAACPKTAGGLAKTESLNAVMREHSPLCCFIAPDALAAVYAAAGKVAPA